MEIEEKLKQLTIRRGTLKAQLTTFTSFVNKLSIDSSKLIQLNVRIENIESVFYNFDNVQSQIEQLDSSDSQLQERESFEDKYFTCISQAKSYIQSSNDSHNLNVEQTPSNFNQIQVKLPQLSLPTFTGKYDEYMHFHDTFDSLINKNHLLSDTQKFQYLISCLHGDSKKVIDSLPICDTNYSVAWQLLRDRYENTKIIIQNHIKEIVDLPTINKESYNQLREFVDTFLKNFRALKNAQQPVDSWNALLIYLLTNKLDYNTKKEWKIHSKNIQDPTVQEFIDFIVERCQILESLQHKFCDSDKVKNNYQNTRGTQKLRVNDKLFAHVVTPENNCIYCNSAHYIANCTKFLELSSYNRLQEIIKLKACTNCLRHGHFKTECRSSNCRICGERHNTLLHINKSTQKSNSNLKSTQSEKKHMSSVNEQKGKNDSPTSSQNIYPDLTEIKVTATHCNVNDSVVLLSTAEIYLINGQGNYIKCRALIDNGSTSNFILQSLFEKLELPSHPINITVAGINNKLTTINYKSKIRIKSSIGDYQSTLPFLIIDRISDKLPQFTFNKDHLKIPSNIKLADENFNTSAPVQVLLGAGIFLELLNVGQIKLGKNQPILQNTKLGYIIAGHMGYVPKQNHCFHTSNHDVQAQLEKFWKNEEVETICPLSKEEAECEAHFLENYEREENGRFIVKLPLKNNVNQLGDSQKVAIKRFFNLENKLIKNPSLYDQYKTFMHEYLTLGHMTEISNTGQPKLVYYLPHHCVIKESSLTTKCRVVFDASCNTSTGLSLNDVLKTGPNIQDDLFSIITRARKHEIIIMADITKMYRQIKIHQSQRNLQRIVWRANQKEPLKHFQLNTITYGTSSASFLSTRCLQQAAKDYAHIFPNESKIIIKDFYVDNLMSGCDNVEDAQVLIQNIQRILGSAGMELRQWMSNYPEALIKIAKNNRVDKFIITETNKANALGLTWDGKNDFFLYDTQIQTNVQCVTKRQILSIVSRIFDPLGLIGPVIISAKILLQQLWKLNLGWDELIPNDIQSRFLAYITQLNYLHYIRIPRKLLLRKRSSIQIHGFCDASLLAYGACVYIRSENENSVLVRLVCGKSRVSPIQTVTIPRLELCSAVLLCKLINQVLKALDMNIDKTFYWSDSTIVLAWIKTDPAKLKTFVSNRVSQIQRLSKGNWNHVYTNDNPADLISRGITPQELKESKIWWEGPIWLSQNDIQISTTPECCVQDIPDFKKVTSLLSTTVNTEYIFLKYSSYTKLIRISSYIFRFFNNCKNLLKLTGNLTVSELNNTVTKLIKLVQTDRFPNEIKLLKNYKQNLKNTKLNNLNPFLDNQGLIRVGGRLQKSLLNYSQTHQIILPSKHPFTTLLIKHEHHRNLHAAAQIVLSSIRQNYWIINGRQTIRSVLRRCITCFRANPISLSQQMGELPSSRVTPGRVFEAVGIDYAGPFELKDGKTRNRIIVKTYICIFVCLKIKAVHMELAGDLTSTSFLNCLKRFISRRGICSLILSDNASNFIGASNYLQMLNSNLEIREYLYNQKIEWKFIPARSPHFGGLWEASVKSAKYYLKRLLNDTRFTYEEFYTLITQIEAVINSRPLIPISNDPNDFETLTPGHFIIGKPLNTLPLPIMDEDVPIGRLSRYMLIQRITQQFWQRWSKDYLNTLQQRTKWKFVKDNGSLIGALVMLKDNNLVPCQWRLARIVEVHPGSDNLIRAVTVKSTKGISRRSITQICVLPIDN